MEHGVLLRYLSVFVMAVALSRIPSVNAFCYAPGRCKSLIKDNKLSTCQQYFTRYREGGGKDHALCYTMTQNASATSKRLDAKGAFLRNLERKQARKDVPTSVLDSDVFNILRESQTTEEGRYSWTTVADLPSWRGTWKICHAPHIETLSGLLGCSFPSVEYDFVTDDGYMVSHSRYESSLFGSGWLNADGRIAVLSTSKVAGADVANARCAPTVGVVKVMFQRFWWDRNGEERPTMVPPAIELDGGGSAVAEGLLAKFVQIVGKMFFFEGLSIFPVRYLDDDLCIFEFKAAGTVVASQRVD